MRKMLLLAALVATAVCSLYTQAQAQEDNAKSSAESAAEQTLLSFPRELDVDDAKIVVHVPEIETWKDFSIVTGRFAVELTVPGEDDPVLGVAEFVADTDVNIEKRVVAVENTEISATSFPLASEQQQVQFDALVRGAVKKHTQFVPLDVVLSYVAPDAKVPDERGLSFEPPPIFYSDLPAILLMTDGEPLLAPIDETKLQYVVNTNWDLFRYRDKEWYLRHGNRWLKTKALDGKWKFDNSLPGDFKKLPDDGNWAEVKASNPPAKGDKSVPVIFTSERPAELIVTDGQPGFSTITAGGLEYVHDTQSDVFRYQSVFYYLVSGRWFSAPVLQGPWLHVKELPAEFAAIPATSPKAHVLAAVPGSDEARLAVLEASVPRKATISRDAGKDIAMYYQGDPVFAAIEGTTVERAVNSSGDVLLFEGVYFLCQEAIWYTSDTAIGPWTVADAVPAAIYTIPPSSASYHVTHVHVYESDDDTVSTGYTGGYFGIHVGFGIAMYGSGWHYPPYYGYGPRYPYYYPYPYSYGASAWYNPRTGMYGRSGSVYGPFGGYGRAASYNPQTGTYARGAAVWDSNEIAGSAAAYNPRTGTGIATNRYVNENGGWGESLITQNDKWVQTRSEWNDYSRQTEFRTSEGTIGETTRTVSGDTVQRSGEFQRGDQSLTTKSVRGPEGGLMGLENGEGERALLGRSAEGDLYAGKDGQVYRRDEDGWYQNSGDGWGKVEPTAEQAARIEGARNDVSDRRESSDRWSGRSTELNRSYDARTNGYQRYDQRRSAGAGNRQRTQQMQPRRRRR